MNIDTLILTIAEWAGVIALGMLVALSPRLQKIRPLQFLFPRREVSVTFSLNTVIFIFSIFLYKYFFKAAGDFATYQPETLLQRIILDVSALLVFGTALVYRKQPLRSALWGKDALRPNIQFSLLIIALVIFLQGKIYAITNGVEATEGVALFQLAIIALCEVTIFFGFSQPRLISRFGPTIGWLISAALFALWQIIPLALNGTVWQSAVFQIILAIGHGLLLGWLIQKSKHVLAPVCYLVLSQWLFLIK
ncbi:MAG TPA: CPBP family intramembrane glutamic endopeptidase [Leptolinea sp.]